MHRIWWGYTNKLLGRKSDKNELYYFHDSTCTTIKRKSSIIMSLYFHSGLGYCTLMCTLIPNLLQLLNGQWLNAHLNCIGINIKIYVASFICDYLTVQAIINSGSYCITLYPIRIRDTEAKCNVFKPLLLIKGYYII